MRCNGGTRPHIESALWLDVKRWFESGALREKRQTTGRWCWYLDGQVRAVVEYQADLEYGSGMLTLDCTGCGDVNAACGPVICTIELESLRCNYGGRIWYFRCPRTGRRARKLYHWPGVHGFCHREAIQPRPTYASQRVGGLRRVEAQRRELRRRMGDVSGSVWGKPNRPERMHWDTYLRHVARDTELAIRQSAYLGLPVDRRVAVAL